MPRAPAKPWSKKKAARRELSPDDAWAAAIRERVLADCHPWQRAAVLDPSRRVSLLVGRGGAKTTSMRARAMIKLTSIRRAELLYLATTREHARELNWDKLKDANEHYGLELRFNESRLVATCARTGARYVMSGMEDDRDIERYRGKPFDEVQPDEAASHDPDRLGRLLFRIIGPRLGERHGCIVLGGTPGHILRGEFYDATRPGSPKHSAYADRDQPGYTRRVWSSHAWSLKQVAELPRAAELYPALVNLWNEALVEKAEQGWSDDNPIWKREYLGQWAADDTDMVFRYRPHHEDGTPFNQWDPFGDHPLEGIQALKAAVAKLRELEPGLSDWRYVISNDMGSSDPFACNVFSFSPADPKRMLWHVLPFERTGMYARPIAGLTIGVDDRGQALHDKPEGIIGAIGWPDGMVMDSDQATLDELSKVYGLRFAKADRNANYKAGAIELTNGDLVDGRIKIIKGSPLEQQLQQLQWAEDQFGKVKENKAQANHSTDTLIYGRKLVAHLYESGAVTADAPTGDAAARSRPAAGPSQDDGFMPGIAPDPEFDSLLADVDFVDSWGNG